MKVLFCLLFLGVAKAAQEGELRLAASDDPLEGRAEIFRNGVWGSICDRKYNTGGWPSSFCMGMGFKRAEDSGPAIDKGLQGTGPINFHAPNCGPATFHEHNDVFNLCPSDAGIGQECTHDMDVWIRCKLKIGQAIPPVPAPEEPVPEEPAPEEPAPEEPAPEEPAPEEPAPEEPAPEEPAPEEENLVMFGESINGKKDEGIALVNINGTLGTICDSKGFSPSKWPTVYCRQMGYGKGDKKYRARDAMHAVDAGFEVTEGPIALHMPDCAPKDTETMQQCEQNSRTGKTRCVDRKGRIMDHLWVVYVWC